jgi:hypothetical protein
MIIDELFEAPQLCPECGGISFSDLILAEKKDACYHKVKASAKVWPSAYASGRLVQCRKKGASNYGNKSESVEEGLDPEKNQRLKDLIDQYRDATDPEASYDLDAEEVIAQIRQEFGDRTADSVEQGPSMHYPRPGHSMGHDPMQYKSSPRITKSGVLNKQDVGSMKRDIKQRLKPGVAEEYELAGVGVAYDLGRRAYRERKTIKDNPYSATREARKYDEWEKGLERGKHDANDAKLFRRSVGEQGMAEGQLEMNTPDPVVVVQDLKGNILDKINLSVAAQKYKLGQPQNIKNQLAHQNYTKVGNYTIVSPMSGQPQDATTQGVAETELDEKSVSQAQFRTMAGAAHNPEFARKVGISQDVAKEFNQADKKSNYKKLPARATEGEQQKGADYRDPKEVDYDDEYDAMVARVKKLAGLGPMKTVYDPTKRVYRNMPTAVQPKK